jgi:hypothetical protein
VPIDGSRVSSYPDEILASNGPLRLAYRRGWSPETSPAGRDTGTSPEASAVATTGQPADRRAETIAGLREATDWLEAHPEVPLPYRPLLQYFVHGDGAESIAELQDIGAALGIAPARSHPGGPHVKVIQPFRGGVSYEAIACDIAREDFEGPDVTPAVGEVPGPDSPQAGPATAAEPEHYHSGGAAGGPGDNEAECACGVTYAGFDSQAEALEALQQHIADPAESVQDWWFTFGAGQEFADRYVVINGSHVTARALMVHHFGQRWCDQYESAERAGVDEFGLTRLDVADWPLPRLVHPAPITDPALTDPADDPVWVAAERKGIDYHALPSGSRTTCGRATAKGHRLRRSEAAEFGRPCVRCYPEG